LKTKVLVKEDILMKMMIKGRMFEMIERDGLARVGKLYTKRGAVRTPALMPVINPNIEIIKAGDMHRYGCEIAMTNAYIIKKSGIKTKTNVHDLLGFDGPIMTDSGTFQSHVYKNKNITITNREIIEFEGEIGSDIATILDEFVEPEYSYEKAKSLTLETIKRAKEAFEIKNDKMILALPVQGGIFEDLRKKCARSYYNFEGVFPIGGVVPLMENQRYSDLFRVILASKSALNPSMPVHLFGCGHPMLFSIAALLGCDLFDSASYSKYAMEDKMLFENGTYPLENLREDVCRCPACAPHHIDEIKKMDKKRREKLIAEHNLYICFQEIERVRNAIKNGRIWELAEQRARSHPMLLQGFKALKKYRKLLERYEPLSRKSSLATGIESLERPLVTRARKRICFFDGVRVVDSFIPYPVELDSTYPFAQSIIPYKKRGELNKVVKKFGCEVIKAGEKHKVDDIPRIRAILRMQFGMGIEDLLLNGSIRFVKSKRNNKIRNVFCNEEHILSLRAEDGFFSLKIAGAKKLLSLPSPQLRVIVNEDSAEFNREGHNVFSKFVINADKNMIPGNEVMVVNESDDLLAVGKAFMIREEMLTFKRGIAVKVREGILS
jgi:7-cyano-7-deazaguanine tRNA-ribosyltransferase